MRIFLNILLLVLSLSLAACATGGKHHHVYAPISDATIEKIPKNGVHRVRPGETLYSIAWRYGLDYRDLARRNGLNDSYHIEIGELLYLRGTASLAGIHHEKSPQHHAAPVVLHQPTHVEPKLKTFEPEREPTAQVDYWQWPARGNVVGNYSSTNKGMNIAGQEGEPIYAAAAGKVVYSGNGLRGYGNLIIIKHNSTYLTAYAHNSKNLVSEGEWIKAGQYIAQMGETGSGRAMLHFEIRRSGQPVNPLDYLHR